MSIGKGVATGLKGLIELARGWDDLSSTSLPQYAKKTQISSRVYIENTIADEPVLGDILRNVHKLYASWIFTALQLNNYISEDKTVRDMIQVVGSENFINNYIGDEIIGVENFTDHFGPYSNIRKKNTEQQAALAADKRAYNTASTSAISKGRDVELPSGQLLQIKFGSGEKSVLVNLLVSILPRILPSDVCSQIVELNFTKQLAIRWLQYKSGEIEFWNDFVLQRDILKDRRNALKQDKTGDLADFIDRQRNSLSKQLAKFLFRFVKQGDLQNIANSVIVMDKTSFERAANKANMNFDRYSDRQKFFSKSYAMMVVTVDPMYNRVSMYFNGLQDRADFSFAQMKEAAKSDKTGLVEFMNAISQGQTPRF